MTHTAGKATVPAGEASPVLDPLMAEARRVLTLCNVCGYCTGYCEMFRSQRRKRALSDADLYYLAVLCHNCRSCYYACQYAPPHAYAINVPALMARVRQRAYREYGWPSLGAGVSDQVVPVFATVLSVLLIVAVPLFLMASVPSDVLFSGHSGPGSFYRIMPWGWMTALGAVTFGFGLLSLVLSSVRFWRLIAPGVSLLSAAAVLPTVLREALLLHNLTGGGYGCTDHDDTPSDIRRRLHQMLVLGVGLCFAASGAGAAAHHFLGWQAPYSWFSLPVLLGTSGGILILGACAGLAGRKMGLDPGPTAPETLKEDTTFLGLLAAVSLSGLALLALRETGIMGILLGLHMGSVMGLFLTFSLGKLRHVPFRLAALSRAALERKHG
ncbi:tricarballylate utilization 4Fe-4S protein TcuB [Phaeovibrio sulfidiphilus]|uniref:Tricarballylate utilization 4Fe-4S protein TcuB n=1 Tax=Phaeovibrio sulfidiphilus TaxID=1220600 RepID=A0A8J7CNV7_9PROT|nr:tricarballylate utilization 4Fe-4S protein TcuB [Phaeovibrio sulfidiphilus]MBE1236347.1 tricarballylate utilization 4Fe-4S protein TcuB [Phaeovibrio sulfidiphilus]